MRTSSWRAAALGCAVALVALAPSAWAQAPAGRPDDSTVGLRGLDREESEKASGAEKDNATRRLEWQRKAWGVPTAAYRRNAIKEGKGHSFRKNEGVAGPRWVNIGPTNAAYEQNGSFTGHVRDSGRVRTILTHPTLADVVYVLKSGGGLWKTTNWRSGPEELQWKVLTDDLPTTGGGSVAFGANPNTLYLGLGDPYDQILVGGAMVKSKNGGVNWRTPIELGTAVSVRDVKVDTSTTQDIVLVATDNGLFRSSDSGESYTEIAAFTGMSVWSIQRTSAGWLASAQPCPAVAVGLRCNLPTALSVSTDRGANWTPITNAGGIFASAGRTTLAVGQPGDSVVYAYSSNVADTQMQDVFRSADGGQTWVANGVNATKAPTNPVTGMTNMNICHGQCWYNQMVLVDPRDASRNTVWIGGDLATARTIDGGLTWTVETWWLYSQFPALRYAHADHHAAAFKTTGTPTIILGNDGGLNISTDNGATFSSDKNIGMASHLFYTVSGNKEFPNLVIGGTQDNGTRLRTDNGTLYNQVIGGDGMGAAYSQANTNTVIGSSQGSGMRTTLSNNVPDVFQNWVAATTGLADGAGAGFFTAVVPAPANLDPTGRVFFHFTASRVWRSNNGGLNWTMIGSATAPTSPGLPAARRFRSSSYNLGVNPTDLNRIVLGAGGGFIDVTTDGGATWTDIDLITLVPGFQGFITNVTWQDNQNIWITAVAQAVGAVRVIKASIASPTDPWSTATFTAMQNGLPDLPVTRVLFDPRDATRNTIYAATHVGMYSTTDGGANWSPFGTGLPTVRVNDIYMPPDGSFMRIATFGRGIWELPQLELVSVAITDEGNACPPDGVLDNGEAGELAVTLKNQGSQTVSQATVTITSSNPNVTFPDGNVMNFPPIQKRGQSTGTIAIALNGASGIETTDLQLAVDAAELNLPSAMNLVSTHRLNYNEVPAVSAIETAEAVNGGWTVAGDAAALPNITFWKRRKLSASQHVWWGPDNNGQTDGIKTDAPDEQSLASPVLSVHATNPLVLSFQHRFSFEGGAWDGGKIEISTDGGSNWTDVGTPVYNGVTNAATDAPIGAGVPAFINRMTGWPTFAPVSLDLGTAFAGQNVQFRFRIGADSSTGAPGWEIDDINVSGLTNTPFAGLVADTGTCAAAVGKRTVIGRR